jgi:hypothetical protein
MDTQQLLKVKQPEEILKPREEYDYLLKWGEKTRTDTRQDQLYIPLQLQVQLQKQEQRQEQVHVPISKIKMPEPIKIREPKIEPKLIVLPGTKTLTETQPFLQPRASQAFKVLVRAGGAWKLKGAGLPFGKAMAKGVSVTAKTAARSFRLLPSGFTSLEDVQRPSLRNYYRRGGSYIEKVEAAINTPGELKEITFKGLMGKRFKYSGRLRGLL